MITDGFIEYLNPKFQLIFKISKNGFEFNRNGGYTQQKIDKESGISKKLKKRRFKKWGTILTILLSIITLLFTILLSC